jgi:peptidoglycan/xylan/chitin deacetylase (PgdA/CDA1 family)
VVDAKTRRSLLTREAFVRDLREVEHRYEEVTGKPMPRIWRAPYGEINRELLDWAAGTGWSHVGWTHDDGGRRTLDSLDWVAERSSRNYLTSAEIAARIRSFGAGEGGLNGGIVLMHLCTRREDPQVTRLGDLIDSLRGDGYRLVTVTDLQRDAAASPALSTLAAARSPAGE